MYWSPKITTPLLPHQLSSPDELVRTTVLEILLATPHVAAALFFMYLCGVVISFLLFQSNPKFKKQPAATNSYAFNLAIGVLPGCVVMAAYSYFVLDVLPTTLDHLSAASVPSSLILAGISFLFVLIKAFK